MIQGIEVSEFFHRGMPVDDGWQQVSTQPDAITQLGQLQGLAWQAGERTTVGQFHRQRGELTRDSPPDLDGSDHWYRVRLLNDHWAPGSRRLLVFDGLATLATIWVDGELVLETENMYRRYAVEVSDSLQPWTDLVVRFRALTPALKLRKGPRRWPTRLVEHRNLRFFRTTLLGRMPGWTPPWPVVGPFGPVRQVSTHGIVLHRLRCAPTVDDVGPCVELFVELSLPSGQDLEGLFLDIEGIATAVPAQVHSGAGAAGGSSPVLYTARAIVRAPHAALWWPHTHGRQPLYASELRVRYAGHEECFEVGPLGFRKITLLPAASFGFQVNDVDVFCRGACWAPLDVVTLSASVTELREALEQARDGGMNMLRISGTLSYECAAFHQLCDELGIMVWQDFMFANMDYPRDDARFNEEVKAEVAQVVERLSARCSTVLLCGGSETEQQAAMMGLPSDQWEHPLWREQLPRWIDELCPALPYWYSSPGGEGMPFWPQDGCTHYYGVGAYLRPLSDARAAGVRFASECLGFANLPEPDLDDQQVGEDPRGRVPRDNGSDWDFGDVTDHYLRRLFGHDPARLRAEDPLAYGRLARRTTAVVMAEVQAHFRDPGTECRGSLIWMLRDLEPGSGWGLIDFRGRPKSAYLALKECWAPRAMWFVDEGLSGLTLVIANEPQDALHGELELRLTRSDGMVVDRSARSVIVPARGAIRLRVEEVFGRFLDTTRAYRFGSGNFDTIRAACMTEVGVRLESSRAIGPFDGQGIANASG
jgi:beta-mannosidase